MKWEKKTRAGDILLESVLIIILGSLLLQVAKTAPWLWAVIVSSIIAGTYGFLKYSLRVNALKWKGRTMPEVIITRTEVIANGKIISFHSDKRWLRRVTINELKDMNIFEITYEWQTRKGVNFDEIRVPVPRGRLREAIETQDLLNAI